MQTMLGIDLGTSAVKVALFAADGRVVQSASETYPLSHPHPGWAEQNPEDWWQATVRAIQTCLSAAGPTDLRGLAISGQMHGAVLLDATDQPVRPCIIWADTRCQAECDEMTALVGQQRLIDLVSNPALPGFTAPKLLWVRNHEPEVWARVRRVLLPKDYLRRRLTGVAAMEISDAAGTCLLDVVQGAWSQEVLARLALDPALLPPIMGAAEIGGQIMPAVAEMTGLPSGLPVAGGGADNACAAVGAGIVAPGQALVSIGTSGVVLAFSPTPQVDRSGPIPRVHTFNHAAPGAWYLMAVTQGAGLSLRWARDQLAQSEAAEAQAIGRDVYDVMAEAAAQVPPGSEGLLFLPYLQGERTPILDAEARGGWLGLTARHTRAHLFRAVLEGVAFSLRQGLDVLREAGVGVSELRVTGGGARSPVWRQILADIFEQPLVPLRAEEGPAFGAALLAGVATGVYPSVQAACTQVVAVGDAVQPDATNAPRYRELYRLYQGLYPALRETMHALAALP
jgi:xylulokinase